jgi:Fe-S-cluster containining protein
VGEVAFADAYLRHDEDGDSIMAATPCPFLGPDRLCAVYEARPRACRAYPHTETDFSKHLGLHVGNLPVCPAVWMVVERLTEGLR